MTTESSSACVVIERMISLITIAVLAFAILAATIRIENKQVQQSREINSAIEVIEHYREQTK